MHLVYPTKFCITIVLVLQFISPEKSDINGYAIVFVFLFFLGGGGGGEGKQDVIAYCM